MLLDFTGKVILVIGRSTGMGRATALPFGRQGVRVVIGDVSEGGAGTADLIKQAAGEGVFVRTNVADAGEVEALVARAVETYGGLTLHMWRRSTA